SFFWKHGLDSLPVTASWHGVHRAPTGSSRFSCPCTERRKRPNRSNVQSGRFLVSLILLSNLSLFIGKRSIDSRKWPSDSGAVVPIFPCAPFRRPFRSTPLTIESAHWSMPNPSPAGDGL